MGIKNFFARVGTAIKSHASDIMMGAGTAGVLGGTVMLCRETLKAKDILNEYREAKAELEADESEKKDITKLKVKTAGKIALNYAPGALMEGAGLGSMWGGYGKVKTALVGLGAAYSGLQEAFGHYRGNVIDEYGEEVDQKMLYTVKEEEIEVKKEDGTVTKEKVKVYPKEVSMMGSPYARYFAYGEADEADKTDSYNKHYLETREEIFNNILRTQRKLMLSEVYREFGIKQSVASNHVGWIYDPDAPEGDNRVNLRARKVYRQAYDIYGNPDGYEQVWMIDPNVDGMVEEKAVRLGLMVA